MNNFLILLLSLIGFCNTLSPLQEIVNANNLLTASLYKQIVKNGEPNLLISPYSAEIVLAWVHYGCKGETAQELRNGLHLPDDKNTVKSGINESLSILKGNDVYTLNVANKMYVTEDILINQEFKNNSIEVFGADAENIKFTRNVEAAKTMNEWVEQQTKNKIKNLINSNILDKNTIAILINAVYFQGNWSNKFDEDITYRRKFYTTISDFKEVDTMYHFEEYFNYYENTELNAKYLEMPFKSGEVSMVIALPNEKEGLSSLENQVEKVFGSHNFQPQLVNIALPKFKIETTLPLVDTLKELGIKKIFDRNEADLSGVAGKKGDLVISEALQKTYIKVEEGGVEAAGATFSKIHLIGPRPPRPRPKDFIADHPFMFYIKAKEFIIFAGKVSNPSFTL